MKYQAISNNADGLDDGPRVPIKRNGKKYFLDLNKGENLSQQHYRIRKGDTVVFRQCASLYGCDVKLFSEVPPDGEPYIRGKYRPVDDDCVKPPLPGSFHYYFTTDGSDKNIEGEGYILVEPHLKIGEHHLPLDCIQCITYLSKCLGPLTTWREKLAVARETGYNMIHFTPIQEKELNDVPAESSWIPGVIERLNNRGNQLARKRRRLLKELEETRKRKTE